MQTILTDQTKINSIIKHKVSGKIALVLDDYYGGKIIKYLGHAIPHYLNRLNYDRFEVVQI